MKKTLTGSVSHAEETVKELRADRQFAIEYLKAAQEGKPTPPPSAPTDAHLKTGSKAAPNPTPKRRR